MKKYICKHCNYTSNTTKNFDFILKKINKRAIEITYICKECSEKEVE